MTNPYCLEGADPNYPTYFTCVVGQNDVPNAHAAVGADLDGWISQYAVFYFKTLQADLRATGSPVPYFGLDTTGSWGALSYSRFSFGAAPYVDGEFIQLYEDSTVPADAVAYQYQTHYGTDLPLMNFLTLTAETDSAESCTSQPLAGGSVSNQAQRGQLYFNTLNCFLTTPGSNGTTPFVGFDWWSWIDFGNANQGLVSVHDNIYDGIEAVNPIVACDPYYTLLSGAQCGNKSTTYGNAIIQITNGNAIWLGGTPPPTFPVRPDRRSSLWGLLSGDTPVQDSFGIEGFGFKGDRTRGLNLFGRGTNAEPLHAVEVGRLQSQFALDESFQPHERQQLPAPISGAHSERNDRSGLGDADHLPKVRPQMPDARKVLKHAVGQHEVSRLVGQPTEPAFIRQPEFYVLKRLLLSDFDHLAGQVKCNDVPDFFRNCTRDPADTAANFDDGAVWKISRNTFEAIPDGQTGLPEVVQVAPVVGAIR